MRFKIGDLIEIYVDNKTTFGLIYSLPNDGHNILLSGGQEYYNVLIDGIKCVVWEKVIVGVVSAI